MYDELITRLRDAAKVSAALAVVLPQSGGNGMVKLLDDAANAIEELSKIASGYHEPKLLTNYERISAMKIEELATQLAIEQYAAIKMVMTVLHEGLVGAGIIDEAEAQELIDGLEKGAQEKWDGIVQEKLDWLRQEATNEN